jgi:hypothetical protein
MIGLVELIVLIAAVGGSSWLVGMLAWLWHRVSRLEDGRERVARLEGAVEELEERLEELRRSGVELRSRLDFQERLLEEGGDAGSRRLGPASAPPPAHGDPGP